MSRGFILFIVAVMVIIIGAGYWYIRASLKPMVDAQAEREQFIRDTLEFMPADEGNASAVRSM